MKKTLKKYRGIRVKGRQVKIEDVIKLKPKDKPIFEKYITFVSGSAGKKRVDKIKRELLVIHDTSEIGLSEWDYDKLNQFLAVLNRSNLAKYSSNDYKKTLKSFLKFQYDDWNKRFKGMTQEGLKQTNPVNKEKLNKETLIKPNEFELLITGANDKPTFRVYLHVLYKGACRPEEVLKLKFRDIDLNKGRVRLDSSKTGQTRYIFVDDDCLKDLKHYKENEYPYPNPNNDDWVFVSSQKRSVHVSTPTLHHWLKKLCESRIGRTNINLYTFRHTRLNFLRKKLSPDAYEMFSGHSLDTGMKFYSHNDDEDLKEELYSKVFQKKDIPEDLKHELELKVEELTKKLDKQMKSRENVLKEVSEMRKNLDKLNSIPPNVLETLTHPEVIKKIVQIHNSSKS